MLPKVVKQHIALGLLKALKQQEGRNQRNVLPPATLTQAASTRQWLESFHVAALSRLCCSLTGD